MTGGAIGLAMGIAGVVLSLGFVGSKLIEMSSHVRGLAFLGSYGSAFLAFAAVAIYVSLNTVVAAKLGGILQRLSVRMQWAEGSYRAELNTLLHRSFHVAVLHGERAQKVVNARRYLDIDKTWASLNRVTAGYLGFELVHNFIGSRIVAYAPGLLPYMDNKVSLQHYVTGAELANALINECSWFIHVMPDIATLRANARRITDLAVAIETVQRPEAFYSQTGLYEFQYTKQDSALGLALRRIELLHAGADLPFLAAADLRFLPGEWTLVVGESGSGKTSILKAINGLWAHGRGTIAMPRHVRTLYAAQDVKLQVVSLKDLVCLPNAAEDYPDTRVAVALHEAGLGELIDELLKDGHRGRQRQFHGRHPARAIDGERIAGERRDHHRDDGRAGHDDQRIDCIAAERPAAPGADIGVEIQARREGPDGPHEFLVGLEGAVDHPDEGEDYHQHMEREEGEHDRARAVPAADSVHGSPLRRRNRKTIQAASAVSTICTKPMVAA